MKLLFFVIEHLCTLLYTASIPLLRNYLNLMWQKWPQFNVAEMTSIQCGLEITIFYRIPLLYIKYKLNAFAHTHTILHLHKLRGQSCWWASAGIGIQEHDAPIPYAPHNQTIPEPEHTLFWSYKLDSPSQVGRTSPGLQYEPCCSLISLSSTGAS